MAIARLSVSDLRKIKTRHTSRLDARGVLRGYEREQTFHEIAARYLDIALPPRVRPIWTTFPIHGWRAYKTASALKRQGVKPGWPDILIVLPPRGELVGLELKAIGTRLSAEQVHRHDLLSDAGVRIAVVHTLMQIERALISWGLTLHATVNQLGATEIIKINSAPS